MSGAICRDQSCLVFRELEVLKKGVELILLLSSKKVRRTQIMYIDDADFFSNRKDCIKQIQMIIDMYVKLYEATEAKVQEEKVKFYCWHYNMVDGKRVIEQIEAVVYIHGKQIVQIDVNNSTRILGVHVIPALSWKTQFEILRAKVVDGIAKVMRTSLMY